MNVSQCIAAFHKALSDRGYTMLKVRYEWEGGKTYYSVKWAPLVVAPWAGKYPTNGVWGPNPGVILRKLESLPSQMPDV